MKKDSLSHFEQFYCREEKESYTIASGKDEGTSTFVFFNDEHFSMPFFLVILIGCKISIGGVLLMLLFVVVVVVVVHRSDERGDEWCSWSWEFVLTISCCVESMVIVPLLFVLDGDDPPWCCWSDEWTGFSCLWLFKQLYWRFRQPRPRPRDDDA